MELPKVVESMVPDARDAGMRLAGRQFIKMTREPIISFLCGHLGPDDPSLRAKVGDFLDTEMGAALVASLLSLGLMTLPEAVGEMPKLLSRELRVQAMTILGDVVADLLMGPLRQVVSDFLRGAAPLALPQESSMLVPVPDLKSESSSAPTPIPQEISAKK